MSSVSAGLILIKVSYVFAAEHLPFLKETREAAAKTAVVFQMVCMEQKNDIFHTEILLKTNLFYTD